MRLVALISTLLVTTSLAATTPFTPSQQPFLISPQTARKFAPILKFSPLEQHFPSSMEFILAHSTLKSKDDASFSIHHPSALDLYNHPTGSYYLDLDNDPVARVGQPVEDGRVLAPMYVSAQSTADDAIAITYMFLYPFQPSQLLRVKTPIYSTEFIIESFGEHQGDLERITVYVSKDLKSIIKVNFSHHNDDTDYAPNQMLWEGTHAIVRVGLNAHPSYNARVFNTSFVQTFDYPIKQLGTHLYAIDVIGDPFGNRQGPQWRPHERENGLVLIGLDDEGKVMGNKPWVAFKGDLGASAKSSAKRVLEIDGSRVPASKEWLIKLVAKLFDSKIPEEFKVSHGPSSFGARTYVNGLHKH